MKMEESEILTISVDKSKKKAFLQMLKLFDFVKLESPKDFISRYIKTAPKNGTISEKEVLSEITRHRRFK